MISDDLRLMRARWMATWEATQLATISLAKTCAMGRGEWMSGDGTVRSPRSRLVGHLLLSRRMVPRASLLWIEVFSASALEAAWRRATRRSCRPCSGVRVARQHSLDVTPWLTPARYGVARCGAFSPATRPGAVHYLPTPLNARSRRTGLAVAAGWVRGVKK